MSALPPKADIGSWLDCPLRANRVTMRSSTPAAEIACTNRLYFAQKLSLSGALCAKPPYDVVKDFEPVSLLADTPQWIVARKTLPAKDLSELIAWLKENPGKATAGTVGVGGPEITGIYFQKTTGTSFQFV